MDMTLSKTAKDKAPVVLWLPYQGDKLWQKNEHGLIKTVLFANTHYRNAWLRCRYGSKVRTVWRQARRLGLVPEAV